MLRLRHVKIEIPSKIYLHLRWCFMRSHKHISALLKCCSSIYNQSNNLNVKLHIIFSLFDLMRALSCVLSLHQQLRNQNLLELLFIVVMVGHKADDKYTFKVCPIHTIDVMVV